jgi:NitT/TauT family transport system substrate-binding protein
MLSWLLTLKALRWVYTGCAAVKLGLLTKSQIKNTEETSMRTGKNARAMLGVIVALAATTMVSTANAQTKTLKEVTVVLPNPSALNAFPMHVAIGEGYFEQEGLKIRVEAVDGSAAVLQALSSGQAHFGNPGPGPVLAARERGVDVVFIYNFNPKSVFGVMVKEESPYKSPEDLKGKTIGIGTRDGAEVGFTTAILNGLKMKEGQDYKFLVVGDGGMAAVGFQRGDMDAYAAAGSDMAILGSKGMKMRDITPAQYQTFFGNGFAAMRSFIDQNPDVVEKFGRAIVWGTRFGMDPANEAKVLKHTAAANPQEGENAAMAKALLDMKRDRMKPVNASNPWGYQDPEHWKAWHDSQIASGGLKKPLDLKAAFTNDFVTKWNAQ